MDLVTRVLKLLAIFATASLWLYYLATSLPPRDATNSNSASTIKFPKSFEELHRLSDLLRDYSDGHFSLVLLLFSSAYLYKQAFAIPGSVFLNILAGALYGPVYGRGFGKRLLEFLVFFYFCDFITSHLAQFYLNGQFLLLLILMR